MMDRADRLSEEVGTLCKKAGKQQHYHDGSAPEGRGLRINRDWWRTEPGLTHVAADASETDMDSADF